MKGESSINTHTLSCVEWIAGEKLLCKTESQPSVGLRDDLEGEPGGAKGSSRPKGRVFLLCGGNQGSIAERLSAKKERKKERQIHPQIFYIEKGIEKSNGFRATQFLLRFGNWWLQLPRKLFNPQEKVYTKDIEWGLTLILNASFIGFLFHSKISMVKMYNH